MLPSIGEPLQAGVGEPCGTPGLGWGPGCEVRHRHGVHRSQRDSYASRCRRLGRGGTFRLADGPSASGHCLGLSS